MEGLLATVNRTVYMIRSRYLLGGQYYYIQENKEVNTERLYTGPSPDAGPSPDPVHLYTKKVFTESKHDKTGQKSP